MSGGSVRKDMEISLEEAEALLLRDAKGALEEARGLLGGAARDCELVGWASLVFNVGAPAVERSRALRKWRRGDMKGSREEFVDFCRSGGRVMQGLIVRRNVEWETIEGKT